MKLAIVFVSVFLSTACKQAPPSGTANVTSAPLAPTASSKIACEVPEERLPCGVDRGCSVECRGNVRPACTQATCDGPRVSSSKCACEPNGDTRAQAVGIPEQWFTCDPRTRNGEYHDLGCSLECPDGQFADFHGPRCVGTTFVPSSCTCLPR